MNSVQGEFDGEVSWYNAWEADSHRSTSAAVASRWAG